MFADIFNIREGAAGGTYDNGALEDLEERN